MEVRFCVEVVGGERAEFQVGFGGMIVYWELYIEIVVLYVDYVFFFGVVFLYQDIYGST